MSSDSAVVEADGGAHNQDSSSALHVPSHQNLDESFEVTDQSLADTAIMGDHELPLIVDRSSTIAQFRKTGGPAVAIVPSESPLRPAAKLCAKQCTGLKQANRRTKAYLLILFRRENNSLCLRREASSFPKSAREIELLPVGVQHADRTKTLGGHSSTNQNDSEENDQDHVKPA